jgi:hypothetical protein
MVLVIVELNGVTFKDCWVPEIPQPEFPSDKFIAVPAATFV